MGKRVIVNEKYESFVDMFPTTLSDAEKIMKETVSQANCELWFKERTERQTASQFGKVCKRKKAVNKVFLKDIFIPHATSCGRFNVFDPSVSQSVGLSVSHSFSQSCFSCQRQSSETAQQNFVKLCSYEGHNL